MISECKDQLPPSPPDGSKHATQMKSKISYTRDFLLCFSQLDICKKLPSGFDASILSEFEDGYSSSTLEWQRSLGGSSLQNPKRNDYGLLPPNRLEGSSNLSRGSTGRWDTRSSGSSDRDGDMQSDRESFTQDSGRRFGNQTRHFWQRPEHDGLLGSGAFSRPSAYAGNSAQKAQGSGQYQLNRSTEPYQPPRPYKDVTYSRKETDLCNDETFGSAECSSEDRAEAERKRRASFELMRKEQQKALHEKKKQIPDNHKENKDADIFALLVNSEDEKSIRNRSNRPDDPVAPTLSQNDSSRSSLHIQAPASRRPVPPGFASAVMEKNISMQSSSTILASEDGVAFSDNNLTLTCMDNDQERRSHSVDCKRRNMLNNDVESISVHTDANENIVIPSSGVQVSKHSVIFENLSSLPFGLPDANDVWEDVMSELSNKQVARSEIMNVDNNHSTSILEKLFGSALSKDHNGSSNLVEGQGVKEEEKTRNSAVSESSKFAHWFPEEEKKTGEDLSSRGLLSLILSNEKAGSQSLSSTDKGIEHFPPSLSSGNKDQMAELLPSSTTSSIAGIPEQYYPGENLTSSSGVLTCEDLEQSILAEVKESTPTLQQSSQGPWLDSKSKEQKADVDDCASQHLLSLLQKGPKESSPRIDVEGFSDDKLAVSDVKGSINLGFADNTTVRNSETVQSSDKTLTLEALFGAAFMNELHSVEAPLSVKRGSAVETINNDVTRSHSLPLQCADNVFYSSTSNENRTNQRIHGGNLPAPNHAQETKICNIPGPSRRYGDTPIEGSKLSDVGFDDGAEEIQLPEEDSLITVGDSLDHTISDSPAFDYANKEQLIPGKRVGLLNGKLFNTILGDGERMSTLGLDGSSLLCGPYDMVDSDNLYSHLHGPPSQFPHQVNHTRPLFPQLDRLPFRNPQMFMGPDSIHHDPHHSFPTNAIPQHAFNTAGGPRFDLAAHHPMLQHMPIPPNFPPHHQIQGLPRSVPLSHPGNHMSGYVPEMNNVHSFPMHNRQPTFAGLGMGLPGVGVGRGPNPEALERLIEMEMRANSKQIHPAAGGHVPGIYGPQYDMNFRYR